jgi:hypothetical protein
MREMSWIRSSKAVAAVALLAIALLAAGTATAIEFNADTPDAAEVGEEVTMSVEITDPFSDPRPSQYTIEGQTELQNPEWTIVARDNTDDIVARSNATNTLEVNADDSIVSIEVEVRGEVPSMDTFNYENPDEENYNVITLNRQGAGLLADGAKWDAHRYTAESQEARNAIDEAADAVDEADSGQDELDSAISAYNNANFELASDLADDAQSSAEGSQQTTQILLIGGALVVLVALVGGGAYVYKQRQKNTNKLR